MKLVVTNETDVRQMHEALGKNIKKKKQTNKQQKLEALMANMRY